jgi:hypothetical protein
VHRVDDVHPGRKPAAVPGAPRTLRTQLELEGPDASLAPPSASRPRVLTALAPGVGRRCARHDAAEERARRLAD